jgi:catechol 2,3-dioxygenase-like lactoylglutathione lyase family enzyme
MQLPPIRDHTANFKRIKTMAKLRHVAMQVPDLEKAAAFYEKCFELKRVVKAETEIGNAIMLSDGVMNLTLLHFPKGTTGGVNGPDWAGLHHIGFIVDDYNETKKMIEKRGRKVLSKTRRRRALRREQIQGPERRCSFPSTTGGKPALRLPPAALIFETATFRVVAGF